MAKTEEQQRAWDEMLYFMNRYPYWYEYESLVKHVQRLCREAGNKIGEENNKELWTERRIDIEKLFDKGFRYKEIMSMTGYTKNQVKNTCQKIRKERHKEGAI